MADISLVARTLRAPGRNGPPLVQKDVGKLDIPITTYSYADGIMLSSSRLYSCAVLRSDQTRRDSERITLGLRIVDIQPLFGMLDFQDVD